MKTRLLGAALVVVLSVFGVVSLANAQTFRSGDTTNVSQSETIDGSAWIAGSAVDIAGKVNGDVFCAGQTVTISGEVDGDVLCAAQTLTISGKVTGDVRVAGQTVAISGDVQGSASAAGQTVTLEGQGNVGRDASFAGQTVRVNGMVGRDLTIGSASATIGSTVGRNVNATVESLTLASGARIAGTVDYIGPKTLTRENGAEVTGKITYTERHVEDKGQAAAGATWMGTLVWSLMLLFSAVVFALIFPRELQRTTDASVAAVPNALLAVLVGLIAGIVMPFIAILLFVTVLGVPLGLLLLAAWALIIMLSGAFAAYYLGRVVWRSQTNVILTMSVGALIVVILLLIPIINVIVWLLSVWYGSGAILLTLKNHAVAPHYDMKKQLPRSRKA